jgi:hypothetical protein
MRTPTEEYGARLGSVPGMWRVIVRGLPEVHAAAVSPSEEETTNHTDKTAKTDKGMFAHTAGLCL